MAQKIWLAGTVHVGASTLIQGQFNKALNYMSIAGTTALNLCDADTCSLPMVRNVMGTVSK